jgi:DNA-binding IclR family transcriptional regulator
MKKSRSEVTPGGVRSLSTATKVLTMLDFIASKPTPMRLSDICKELKMARATAYQQLKTLTDADWLELREDSSYQLSPHVISVASMALRHMHANERAQNVLKDLAQLTGQTASITFIQGGSPIITQSVEADRLIIARQWVGTRLDLMSSASGKAHIIFKDLRIEGELCAQALTSIPKEEVRQIRTEKIAFSEPEVGLLSAATPVLSTGNHCVAALSIVGLSDRSDIKNSRPHLLESAERLALLLGT